MANSLPDAVYGCLIGGAIGDALGAIVEGWSHHRIREEFGRVDTFQAYDNPYSKGNPGSVTDDTIMRQYVCQAISETGGRITADEYAEVLIEHLDTDRVWVTEEIAIRKLLAGISPRTVGRGSIPAAVATMAVAPVGIVNAANPRQAYQDGYDVAGVTQEGVERESAATVAAGVASACDPAATVETILSTMKEHSSETVYRAIDLSMGLLEESATVDEFIHRFYEERLDWRWPAVDWDRERYHRGEVFSGSSLEIVPAAMAVLHYHADDVDAAIVEGASFGRDCDTIGSIVGTLSGTLHGASAIRTDWIETVERANREFFEELSPMQDLDFETTAHHLVGAIENERAGAERRAEQLERFLDDDAW